MKGVKQTIAVTGMALIMLMSSAASFIKADFSGTWVLDQQKSSLGEMGARMAATNLKVTQEGKMITIVRTSAGMNGEMIITDKLTFDGVESKSTGGMENSTKMAASKLSDDQNSLTVNAVTKMSWDGNAFEIKAKEVWTLSADAKTLTIDSETITTMGENKTKLVYNKQ